MQTSIHINTINQLDLSKFRSILSEMIENFGELEITIKPKFEQTINKKLEKNILEVENGAELFYFSPDDFDKLNKQLLSNEEVNINDIKKTHQNEKGSIVYN